MSLERIVIMIEDGLKKAEDYTPAKRVKVELHYGLTGDEDGDEALKMVAQKAQSQVDLMLGKTIKREEPKPAKVATPVEGDKRGPGRPAKVVEPPKSDPHVPVARDEIKVVEVVGDFDFEAPAEKLISDTDVQSETGQCNARTKNHLAIVELIVAHKPDGWDDTVPFGLSRIPQKDRKKFLADLANVPSLK